MLIICHMITSQVRYFFNASNKWINRYFFRKNYVFSFVLLGGHQSIFEVDFFVYTGWITRTVCVHWCYIRKSSLSGRRRIRKNGAYKTAKYKAKKELIKNKSKCFCPIAIEPTNIISILNYTFQMSFDKIKTKKKGNFQTRMGTI